MIDQRIFGPATVSGISFRGYPCSGAITTRYAEVDDLHPMGHSGLDIANVEGTDVQSPAPGEVAYVFRIGIENEAWEKAWQQVFGNVVIVNHGSAYALYGHLSRVSVTKGQRLQRGNLIGKVGHTGFTNRNIESGGKSTGDHLHWGVAPATNPWLQRAQGLIDPLSMIVADPTSASAATYTVRAGDTLGAIARATGTTIVDLAVWNDLADPNVIEVGQVLRLTKPEPAPAGSTAEHRARAALSQLDEADEAVAALTASLASTRSLLEGAVR